MNVPLSAEHPLLRATWLWPEGQLYLINCYAQFRRDFALEQVPSTATLYITADQSYRVWLNGRCLGRGPARGYQRRWPFDEYAVGELLRPGANWISVEAYNPGIGTFAYRHESVAGLLAALVWEGGEILTDRLWKMRRPPGVRRDTARLSLQLAFQEDLDLAAAGGREWIEAAQVDCAEWDRPPAHHWAWESTFAATRPPFESLEPRGIPNLRQELVAPARVRSTATGMGAPDSRDRVNLSWPLLAELDAGQWVAASGSGVVEDGALVVDLPAVGEGRWVAAAVDLAEYSVGTLCVEVEGAQGGEILDFQFHETILGVQPRFHAPGGSCLIALANRLRLRPGAQAHEFFHPLGCASVIAVVRQAPAGLRLRLRFRRVGYAFTQRGRFTCSDAELEAIHAACRRTQAICALDAYVDTPWREQAQWWGDARVQASNTFHLDGDARLLARGIRSLAGQTTAQGLTYGHAPTIAYGCILPDFSLTWILTLWDHYWQTGDLALFREMLPRLGQVLAYFDTPEARGANGLLRHDRRLWYFGDWAELCKEETPTLLNLYYLEALRALVRLAEAAGLPRDAARWRRTADAHQRRILRLLFDRRRGHFRGGLDAAQRPAGPDCVHDQVMALRLDLVPERHSSLVERWVLPLLRGEPVPGAEPSAFWVTYVLQEAIRRGHGALALQFIRRRWRPMLATGTTWEGYHWDEKSGGSASHAWTAHPASHFVAALAGLRQTAPAWRAVVFDPVLPDELDCAEALVPAPPGDLWAGWRRVGREVEFFLTLPAGVTATVPDGAPRTGPGEFRWTRITA